MKVSLSLKKKREHEPYLSQEKKFKLSFEIQQPPGCNSKFFFFVFDKKLFFCFFKNKVATCNTFALDVSVPLKWKTLKDERTSLKLRDLANVFFLKGNKPKVSKKENKAQNTLCSLLLRNTRTPTLFFAKKIGSVTKQHGAAA